MKEWTIHNINNYIVKWIKEHNEHPSSYALIPIKLVETNIHDACMSCEIKGPLEEDIVNCTLKLKEEGKQTIIFSITGKTNHYCDPEPFIDETGIIVNAKDLDSVIIYLIFRHPFDKLEMWEQFYEITPDGPAIGKFSQYTDTESIPFDDFLPLVKETYNK